MAIFSQKSYKEDQFLYKKLDYSTVFVGSTDTILGLMAPLTLAGKEKLDQIKGRQEKPYLIIIGSFEQLDLFISSDTKIRLLPLLERFWPGPLTFILKARPDAPHWYIGKDYTIALRMPNHLPLAKLALINGGLFSTSANISGMPSPQVLEEVDNTIIQKVDFIVLDEKKPDASLNQPSTIVNCTTNPFTIVRQGALNKELIELICSWQ